MVEATEVRMFGSCVKGHKLGIIMTGELDKATDQETLFCPVCGQPFDVDCSELTDVVHDFLLK